MKNIFNNLRSHKIFYGWYIVAAGVFFFGFSGIVSIYGFTAFIEPIAMTFGWSYAQISLASSLRGLESGALTPLMGFLVDRYPAKRLALIGIAILGLGYFCFSQVKNLPMFYISFIIIGFGSSLAIFMVPQTTLVRWFKKDLGKASGLLFIGNGISGLFVPILVFCIDRFGWQTCLIYFAAGLMILGIPVALVYRTRPEDNGLLPDGRAENPAKGLAARENSTNDVSVKQALRMREFWYLGTANLFLLCGWSAFSTHLIPYFSSLGIERSIGGNATMEFAMISFLSRFLFGWFSDIFDKRYVLAVCIAFNSMALFFFWLIEGPSLLLISLFVIAAGIGTGGIMPIRIPIYREYFGLKNFGKIYGFGNIFITIGLISGAPLAGWVYDTWGTYNPIWIILSILTAVAAFIVIITPSSGTITVSR